MLVVGAWLLPSIEPYRTSRTVGGRLRELSSVTGATPMLAAFQEPGVVYALGRPAEIMRTRETLIDRSVRKGLIASALTPAELEVLEEDARLSVEVRETLRGFNLSKGRNETIHLVLIRPTEMARAEVDGLSKTQR